MESSKDVAGISYWDRLDGFAGSVVWERVIPLEKLIGYATIVVENSKYKH